MWNDMCIYIILADYQYGTQRLTIKTLLCTAMLQWRLLVDKMERCILWCASDKTWSSFMHMPTTIWVGYNCHITCMYYYPLKQTLVSVLRTGLSILAFIHLSSCFTPFYIHPRESLLLIYCCLCFMIFLAPVLYYYKITIINNYIIIYIFL